MIDKLSEPNLTKRLDLLAEARSDDPNVRQHLMEARAEIERLKAALLGIARIPRIPCIQGHQNPTVRPAIEYVVGMQIIRIDQLVGIRRPRPRRSLRWNPIKPIGSDHMQRLLHHSLVNVKVVCASRHVAQQHQTLLPFALPAVEIMVTVTQRRLTGIN